MSTSKRTLGAPQSAAENTDTAPPGRPGALRLAPLALPGGEPPGTALGRWMLSGAGSEEAGPRHEETRPWYMVLWLTGVDYFSTLGYQPGIALLAAGALSPIATAVLVTVTLLGAFPIYAQVASRSYIGQGSIAMLERLLPGWYSKLSVLVLLGFATTDFVITMTLSAADAAQHAVGNPWLHPFLGEARLLVTLALLALLAVVFLMGFTEAIGVAIAAAVPYMLLNVMVVFRGAWEILRHPELLSRWRGDLALHGDWTMVLLAAGLLFPKLALGMSGFETGVSMMPLVKGDPPDPPGAFPIGRVCATRKLLAAAAVIMGVMLLATSFITAVLVPKTAYREGGPAAGRALAYLAHQMMGSGFGSIYDLSTILILWFAGASAMAGMLNLIPRYLPRFGMAPRWVAFSRPLVVVLFVVDVLVTLAFKAEVEAQGGAYATGVLVLMLSAAVAVALAMWREAREDKSIRAAVSSFYFWIVTAVFVYTLAVNVHERPDGVIIASLFITATLLVCGLSRYLRATELRVESIEFTDNASAAVWPEMVGRKVNLVPLKHFDEGARLRRAKEIRKRYRLHGPLAFLHIRLRDDRSEFVSALKMQVRRWDEDFVVTVTGAVAIANSIAYISELLDPVSIVLELTRRNPMNQALNYLLWGEGETGVRVYEILVKYWDWTPEQDVRPLIFLSSE